MAKGYSIVSVERITFLNARKNPVDGYLITFRTDEGVVDWVQLADVEYSAETVAKAIEVKLEKHSSVMGL